MEFMKVMQRHILVFLKRRPAWHAAEARRFALPFGQGNPIGKPGRLTRQAVPLLRRRSGIPFLRIVLVLVVVLVLELWTVADE